jgi:hypothetical protein
MNTLGYRFFIFFPSSYLFVFYNTSLHQQQLAADSKEQEIF